MRKTLKHNEGKRMRFKAVFERYGKKSSFKGAPIVTLLFKDVRDTIGNLATDHIWFTTTKEFSKFTFTEGQKVYFTATVKEYWKGYKGRREDVECGVSKDYKLSHPANVQAYDNNSTNELKQQALF